MGNKEFTSTYFRNQLNWIIFIKGKEGSNYPHAGGNEQSTKPKAMSAKRIAPSAAEEGGKRETMIAWPLRWQFPPLIIKAIQGLTSPRPIIAFSVRTSTLDSIAKPHAKFAFTGFFLINMRVFC